MSILLLKKDLNSRFFLLSLFLTWILLYLALQVTSSDGSTIAVENKLNEARSTQAASVVDGAAQTIKYL